MAGFATVLERCLEKYAKICESLEGLHSRSTIHLQILTSNRALVQHQSHKPFLPLDSQMLRGRHGLSSAYSLKQFLQWVYVN